MIVSADIIGSKFKRDEITPFLVEVELPEPTENAFLRVRETLTRIGVASNKAGEENTLYQTCHILSKKGKNYIVHFKTLFVLDGRTNDLTQTDISRANLITNMLQDWGLVKIVKPEMTASPLCSRSNVKVVKHGEKEQWKLIPKYAIGAKAKQEAKARV